MRLPALLLLLALVGCSKPQAPPSGAPAGPGTSPAPPSSPWKVWGCEGREPGQFLTPRGIGVAPDRTLYVVDKSGRVQHLDAEGKYLGQWTLPEFDKGFPEDVKVAPWGEVFIVDTHYYRILRFSPEGKPLGRWGSYGESDGHFSFAVGITFVGDEVFVSEYQGTDRIQVFDREGHYKRRFGSFGEGDGQFNRPEDLCWDASHERFLVADTVNHRIGIFSKDGRWLGSWGRQGEGLGELKYPYDVDVTPDGRVVVCEYGNNRLQVFSPEGKPLGTLGGAGSAPGQFAAPWECEVIPRDGADPCLVVADSLNQRLQLYSGELPR